MRNTPDLTDASAPTGQAYYDASSKGKARRRRYRHDNSKHTTDAVYLSREFLAWDGEGIALEDGTHQYVMLANSDGKHIADSIGLSTERVLAFITSEAARLPGRIHVIYGGGYDYNCWIKHLSREECQRIYSAQYMSWREYTLGWRRGKSFFIKSKEVSVTVYDVVSFFQCAFIKACDDYLGDAFTHRDLIIHNKALRSTFTLADLDSVRVYNDAELENLVRLMQELRARLNRAGLRPSRWDGPGAIAVALMRREGVKQAMAQCPGPVMQAARVAYAGGRFEVARYGAQAGAAWEYDVNSAYPAALRSVPNLAAGQWTYWGHPPCTFVPFALYHLRFENGPNYLPGPLFRRAANGTICYPPNVQGWYWGTEAATALMYADQYGGTLTVLECWQFMEGNAPRPFAFIDKLYDKRQKLKAAGDGAHVGIKLGLNSLWGKTCQQIGWRPGKNGSNIPPYHQLEWAGFVTSSCRATVLRAAMRDLSAVIAFETDALFTSRPLALPINRELGGWEATEFSNLTYIQSGLYFGTTRDGKQITKTRGVDRGSLTHENVLAGLNKLPAVTDATLTRFVGLGIALAQNFGRWRRWETMPKRLSLQPAGKRAHFGCNHCHGDTFRFGVWHDTLCPFLDMAQSAEFPIAWINPDPAMDVLAELRETVTEWDEQ